MCFKTISMQRYCLLKTAFCLLREKKCAWQTTQILHCKTILLNLPYVVSVLFGLPKIYLEIAKCSKSSALVPSKD